MHAIVDLTSGQSLLWLNDSLPAQAIRKALPHGGQICKQQFQTCSLTKLALQAYTPAAPSDQAAVHADRLCMTCRKCHCFHPVVAIVHSSCTIQGSARMPREDTLAPGILTVTHDLAHCKLQGFDQPWSLLCRCVMSDHGSLSELHI